MKKSLQKTKVLFKLPGVQLFGGYGYMAEYPVSRFWTDAREMLGR